MSPSNAELLARAFAGWGNDNPASMRDVLHPDWFTRELWRWFDEFTSTPEGFIDGGDQIVVCEHLGGARPGSLKGRQGAVLGHTIGSATLSHSPR